MFKIGCGYTPKINIKPIILYKITFSLPVSSVKVVPFVDQYTFILPTLSPVELNFVAASKLKVPAVTPVKSIKTSIATAVVLAVVPVESNSIVVVAGVSALPLCTPPDEPVTNVAVEVVVLTPSGIVPVALTATDPQRLAPVPASWAIPKRLPLTIARERTSRTIVFARQSSKHST